MSPTLVARMIRMAVDPSASVALTSSHVRSERLMSSRRPLAILNMKTPGIMAVPVWSRNTRVTAPGGPLTEHGLRQNRQEIDKSAFRRIRYLAKSLAGLVELTGIEPVTS